MKFKLELYKVITIFLLILVMTEIGFEMINAQDSFVNIMGVIIVAVSTFVILTVLTQKKLPRFNPFGRKSNKEEVEG